MLPEGCIKITTQRRQVSITETQPPESHANFFHHHHTSIIIIFFVIIFPRPSTRGKRVNIILITQRDSRWLSPRKIGGGALAPASAEIEPSSAGLNFDPKFAPGEFSFPLPVPVLQ